MRYPEAITKLIEGFEKYPGIGHKTAERLAFFTVNKLDSEKANEFATAIMESKEKIKRCPICGNITDQDICEICSDETRNDDCIMVVEEVKDLIAIEKMNDFKGKYHVLNGVINYQNGVGPKDLNIDSLIERSKKAKEVILATNATVTGEITAKYIKSLLSDVLVTRIGYGLPVGSDLEYADEMTLMKALEGRKEY